MDSLRARCRAISYIILTYILAASLAGIASACADVGPTIYVPELTLIERPAINYEYVEVREECKDEIVNEPVEIVTIEEEEPVVEPTDNQTQEPTVFYIPERDYPIYLSDDEIYLIARIAYAEAGNQCDLGVRFLIDTILNRIDDHRFPNNLYEVVCAPNQYDCVGWGTIWMYELNWHFVDLVKEELANRTDYNVLYYCSWPCDFSYWANYYITIQDHNFYT